LVAIVDPELDPNGNHLSTPGQFLGTAPDPSPAPAPGPTGPPDSSKGGGSGMKSEQDFKNALGGLYDPTTYQSYVSNVSNNGGGDPNDWFNRIVSKEQLRGSNEPNSSYTADGAGGYTTGPTGKVNTTANARTVASGGPNATWTGPPATNVPGQFSDPISSFLEKFAQQQAQRLENPPSGSGQQLLESLLQSVSGQFQGGGYTPAEQELLNSQAINPIEQLRSARKQQVVQQLSARGIGPDSGVYKQMLADVDRQFDTMRGQAQTTLGVNAANHSTERQMSAVQLLQQLAGTQDQRLNSAFNYRTVPYNMAQQSFQDANTLYNQSGNPLSLVNPLAALSQQQQGQSGSQQEALGYLAAILSSMYGGQ
jgi:hypothetical protein